MNVKNLVLSFILLNIFIPTAHSQIINGGFESGDLTAWLQSGQGNSSVLTLNSLTNVTPPEGSFFALISNGPGDIGSDDIPDIHKLMSVPFSVADSGQSISLRWNFLTAEFTGTDADPARLDSFDISLIPDNGSEFSLLSYNVSDAPVFSLIDSGAAVVAPDGSTFFEMTGFQTLTSQIAPGNYRLVFTIKDDGDGSFDSAVAVDSIRILSAPEPSSSYYMYTILLIFIIYKCYLLFHRQLILGHLRNMQTRH